MFLLKLKQCFFSFVVILIGVCCFNEGVKPAVPVQFAKSFISRAIKESVLNKSEPNVNELAQAVLKGFFDSFGHLLYYTSRLEFMLMVPRLAELLPIFDRACIDGIIQGQRNAEAELIEVLVLLKLMPGRYCLPAEFNRKKWQQISESEIVSIAVGKIVDIYLNYTNEVTNLILQSLIDQGYVIGDVDLSGYETP